MLKFTVVTQSVRENKGVGKASGKPYHMFFQTAYAHTFADDGKPNPFPEKLEIICKLDDNTKQPITYPPGEYEMHPASIQMGQYGLEVAPKLVPLKKPA